MGNRVSVMSGKGENLVASPPPPLPHSFTEVHHSPTIPLRAIEGRLSPSTLNLITANESEAKPHPHHLIPTTIISPRRQSVYRKMTPIFTEYKTALTSMFNSHVQTDVKLKRTGGYHKMCEGDFIDLMTEHGVIPDLMSRVEGSEIFRNNRKGARHVDGEVDYRSGVKHHVRYCGYGDFIVMLCEVARRSFSGGKWDKRFPDLGEKARLLLFWIDEGSKVFKGNGPSLMGRVVENQVKDAEEKAVMTFDTEGVEEVQKLFPAWWEGVEREGRAIFRHYCQLADRLNVGPSAGLNRFQFCKIMEDAGIVDKAFTTARVNLAFQKDLVPGEKKLRYERFYDAVARVGVDKFEDEPIITCSKTKYHVKGCGLFIVLLENLLPLASKVAAVSFSQKQRNSEDRRPTNVRSTDWMERWRHIELLREVMRTDEKVRDYFGVADLEDVDSDDSSEDSSEDGSEVYEVGGSNPAHVEAGTVDRKVDGGYREIDDKENRQAPNFIEENMDLRELVEAPLSLPPRQQESLLRTTKKEPQHIASVEISQVAETLQQADTPEQVKLIKTVAELADKARELHESLISNNNSLVDLSVTTVDGLKVVASAAGVLEMIATPQELTSSQQDVTIKAPVIEEVIDSPEKPLERKGVDDRPKGITTPSRRPSFSSQQLTPLSVGRHSRVAHGGELGAGNFHGIPPIVQTFKPASTKPKGGETKQEEEDDAYTYDEDYEDDASSRATLSSLLNEMNSHVKDLDRKYSVERISPPYQAEADVSSAPSPKETAESLLSRGGNLADKLATMESTVVKVEEKQKRHGSLYLAPEVVEDLNFETAVDRTINDFLEGATEADAVTEVEKKSGAPEIEAYKAALQDALSGFGERFSSIENQVVQLSEHMQKIATVEDQKLEMPSSSSPGTDDPISPPPNARRTPRILHPQALRPATTGAMRRTRQSSITFDDECANHPPPNDPEIDSPLILVRETDDVNKSYASPMKPENLTSIAKNHSPPVSNMFAAAPVARVAPLPLGGGTPDKLNRTAYGTPSEGPAGLSVNTLNSPARGALKLTPRYSVTRGDSGESFGDLSLISATDNTLDEGRGIIGSGRRGSVGDRMHGSGFHRRSISTKMGSDKRSPFRTRDRMDDYYRSLREEGARRMSFSKEVREIRSTNAPVRHTGMEVREGYMDSPSSRGGPQIYRLSKEAKDIVASRTPPKSYMSMHAANSGMKRGSGGVEGASSPKASTPMMSRHHI